MPDLLTSKRWPYSWCVFFAVHSSIAVKSLSLLVVIEFFCSFYAPWIDFWILWMGGSDGHPLLSCPQVWGPQILVAAAAKGTRSEVVNGGFKRWTEGRSRYYCNALRGWVSLCLQRIFTYESWNHMEHSNTVLCSSFPSSSLIYLQEPHLLLRMLHSLSPNARHTPGGVGGARGTR